MAYELKIKFKSRCPRHPGFKPVDGAAAGIKANCSQCWALHDVFMRAQKLEEAIQKAQEVIGGETSQKDSD